MLVLVVQHFTLRLFHPFCVFQSHVFVTLSDLPSYAEFATDCVPAVCAFLDYTYLFSLPTAVFV